MAFLPQIYNHKHSQVIDWLFTDRTPLIHSPMGHKSLTINGVVVSNKSSIKKWTKLFSGQNFPDNEVAALMGQKYSP